jgi:DNA ligase-1
MTKRIKAPALMRAVPFSDKKLRLPAYVSPKLDGVRCVTNGHVFFSKNGNAFPHENVGHLQPLSCKPFDTWFDGELIVPGRPVNEIVSIVKRAGHERSRELEFHVFDVLTDGPFASRLGIIHRAFFPKGWRKVHTRRVTTRKELDCYEADMRTQQAEGIIIRTTNGVYAAGNSNDILKLKFEHEAEYEIVGYKEGKGKDAKTPVFICKMENAREFPVRPTGTDIERRAMWRVRSTLIGQKLTVRHLGFTAKNKVPFQPRGIAIRNYE